MEKLDEILNLLRNVTPMLQEFVTWKQEQAEIEKQRAQEETESQKEFAKWLEQRQAEQAQQQADTAEMTKHFYGGEAWKEERFAPKYY